MKSRKRVKATRDKGKKKKRKYAENKGRKKVF